MQPTFDPIYVGLTMAATNMLLAHGDDALKARFLPHLVSGRFFGTMCLSEPHAGSSLAHLRTTATPNGDGTYQIRGTKMWITGGDHDLSENIVHFVLARLPDAALGTGGISLFAVPKFEVDDDGNLGARNDVHLVGLNHKMGYRGSVNGVMNWRIRPLRRLSYRAPHAGLRYVSHDERGPSGHRHRIGGMRLRGPETLCGLCRREASGYKPGDRDQSKPEVMIIEHADVRRMLLAQKAYVEGGAHLSLYCSLLMDQHAAAQAANDDWPIN